MKQGLLLINLGTPKSPTPRAIRQYLREFLSDKRVVDLPCIIRYFLVYGLIAPFRAQSVVSAYQSIWTDEGSPLRVLSQKLIENLRLTLPQYHCIELAMRYGKPSYQDVLKRFHECDSLTILPLYPQYASATTGSSIEALCGQLVKQNIVPSIRTIRDFYNHQAYIKAQAALIQEHLLPDEHLLLSYHGLPERQIKKSGCNNICQNECGELKNPVCYKGQCHHTSRLLADALQLECTQYSTAFQSRLGRTPWIRPYTDEVLKELAAKGIKKIAVACPSFVTDCLETVEEIAIRLKKQWLAEGGVSLKLIPALNDNPLWVDAISEIVRI